MLAWGIQSVSLTAAALALLTAGLVHCIREEQGGHWLLTMIALPIVGPLLYFVALGLDSRRYLATTMAMLPPMTPAEARQHRQRIEPRRAAGIVIPDETQKLALADFVVGDYARAADLFGESLRADSPEWRLRYFHGRALLAAERWKEAIEALQDVVEYNQGFDSGHALLFLARAFDGHGDGERAKLALEAAVEGHRLPEATFELAALENEAGNSEAAEHLLRRVVDAARTAPPFQRRAARYWARRARKLIAEIRRQQSP